VDELLEDVNSCPLQGLDWYFMQDDILEKANSRVKNIYAHRAFENGGATGMASFHQPRKH